jgi:hypothetical protein
LGKGEFGHGGKDTAKNDCWLLVVDYWLTGRVR